MIMKKEIYEKYKISGNKVTHMKLTKISLPENETLTMMNRYRFDEESTKKCCWISTILWKN